MSTRTLRLASYLRLSVPLSPNYSTVNVLKSSKLWHSTDSVGGKDEDGKSDEEVVEFNDIPGEKEDIAPHGVDPSKGWGFRGVHKAIICGRVGQVPLQKILRNGRFVTIFTVGTGGMFDQRKTGAENMTRPAQWHRIAVHNDTLGAYAVQKLIKNSPVYVEGDIETRVYNDSINGEVKHIPEICVRQNGRIRLIKSGESISNKSLEELREGLV